MNSKTTLILIIIASISIIKGQALQWQLDQSLGTVWSLGCDFAGNDISNKPTSGELCASTCVRTFGCTHFTWTRYNGGYCWMKSGMVSQSNAFATADQSMVCGILPTNSPGPSPSSNSLKGLYGVAYSCSSPSNTYCDDWFTTKYKSVYNNPNSVRSLQNVKKLGFNLVRTYYLRPNNDHNDFLSLCDSLNLAVEIGISNNLLDTQNTASIAQLVNQVKSHPSVKLYTVGNEYRNSVNNIVIGIQAVYQADPTRFIMHSSLFDANFATAANVYNNVPANIKSTYIVGINMYFNSNPANTIGQVIQNVISKFYSNSVLSNAYLIVSEYGSNTNDPVRISSFNDGLVQCLKNYSKFLGYSLFAYSDESWKGAASSSYGIVTEAGTIKNSYSAVTNFKSSPGFSSVIKPNL